MNGWYTCDYSLVKGLPNQPSGVDSDPECWCNPNFEWDNYVHGTGARSGITPLLAYKNWGDRQAELGEKRVCNGIVAITDAWWNW